MNQEIIELNKLLKISDYEKPRDYNFTEENYNELKRLNNMLKNCVDYSFDRFSLTIVLDYYSYFFSLIGKFELLQIGFEKLIEISIDETNYSNEKFQKFLKAISDNFEKLNNNLISTEIKNIHYYDVSFISDIQQFKDSIIPPNQENEIEFELF